MNKVAIITLNGNFNFGNRLQNYALSKIVESFGYTPYTYWEKSRKEILKDKIKYYMIFSKKYNRFRKFYRFTKKNINLISNSKLSEIDNVIVGSDQVWNPKYYEENNMLLYNPLKSQNVISYAASLGTDKIAVKYIDNYKNILLKYNAISVREKIGEELLKKITNRNDILTLIDPTLLLSNKEWKKIEKKPKKFNKSKHYLLCYFLGDISDYEKKAIIEFAEKNKLIIINILDKNDLFYISGPEEFLYLIDHSDLICTDSFHSCVFSLLFDKSFIVFKRKGCSDYMYSRIQNLLEIFKLEDREFKNEISNSNLKHNYKEAYRILESEKNNGLKYLKSNLK